MSNSLRQNAPVNDTILVSETCACASPKHPILLATDGSTLAESAVRVGAALAQRADAGALAVSAVLPIPACAFAPDGSMLSVVSAESEEHERWVRGDGIADQLRRAAVPSEWPVFVDTGDATVRKMYKAAAEKHKRERLRVFGKLGLDVVHVTTGGPFVEPFRELRRSRFAVALQQKIGASHCGAMGPRDKREDDIEGYDMIKAIDET